MNKSLKDLLSWKMCAWRLFIPQYYIPYELPFLINQHLDELSYKKLANVVTIHLVPSPLTLLCYDKAVSGHAEKPPCISVFEFASTQPTADKCSAIH